jgi:hypothetical protein
MKRVLAGVVLTVLLVLPAIGQTTSTDPEKAANIQQLLKTMGSEKAFPEHDGPVNDNVETHVHFGSERQCKGTAGDESTDGHYGRGIQSRKSDSQSAALYDKYFTGDEIKGLLAFYQSPVGQKAAQVLPSLTQEAMQDGMKEGQMVAQKSMKRLLDEFPVLKSSLKPPPGF